MPQISGKNLKKTGAYRANGKQVRSIAGIVRWAIAIGLLLLLVTGLGAGFYRWTTAELDFNKPRIEFEVPNGASLGQTIAIMQSAGINLPEWPFKALHKIRGRNSFVKAGVYEVTSSITPTQLLEKLLKGEVATVEFVFPEGWLFRQVRARLSQTPGIKQDIDGVSDSEVLRLIGAAENHPEGLFFPDTYRVNKGASASSVLKNGYRVMQNRIGAAWTTRQANLPLRSPYEALVLASIVEKETGLASDRPMIASVFINRLRLGMRLQTDPSVIYGLGAGFDGNLRKRDLTQDTPYNSYTRNGLPPTPIAMPGEASIKATLNPATSDALYFVARGDGSSEFSSTLDAHNRAVNRYQRGGK